MSPRRHWRGFATFRGVGELLGYARVSTLEQNADLQRDALSAAGCWRVFTDHVSGVRDRRPELDRVLEALRPGDTLVVWRLDRLGRSLRHLSLELFSHRFAECWPGPARGSAVADRSSRQRRFTEPACALGAVLQRLTIDAVTPDEVQTCLHAIRAGFAAEGLVLTVPTDPGAVAALGPRLTPGCGDSPARATPPP